MPSGGGDGETTLSDFTNPDADSLLGRVDYRGIIALFGKSGVLAIISGFVGAVMAVADSFGNLMDAVQEFVTAVVTGFAGVPNDVQQQAAEAASEELSVFGLFAAPVSAVVALTAVFAMLFILSLVLGDPE